MNEYVGKNCPFCKTGFVPGDDIVVCSACDMPHHRDCWAENQGCTTFGCLGTISCVGSAGSSVIAKELTFEDTPAPAAFCPYCGTPAATGNAFCSGCGSPLNSGSAPRPAQPQSYSYTAPQPTQPQSYGYTTPQSQSPIYSPQQSNAGYNLYGQPNAAQSTQADGELAYMVGTKAEYYLPKFQEMKLQNKKTSWNWAAFLCPGFWFVYRKMYGYGLGILGAALVSVLMHQTIITLALYVGYAVLGVYANDIYMNYLEKNLQQYRTLYEPEKSRFMQEHRDVNMTAAILSMVGYVVVAMALLL